MRPGREAGAAGIAVPEDAEEQEKKQRKTDAGRCKRSEEPPQTTAAVEAPHLKVPQEKASTASMKLTKYERVHVLSVRANELAAGSDPLLPTPGVLDPLLIAMEEMDRGLLAARVVRTLPSGEREVHELMALL
jgi:DNA-directed RNA polymerase subunit K/omega